MTFYSFLADTAQVRSWHHQRKYVSSHIFNSYEREVFLCLNGDMDVLYEHKDFVYRIRRMINDIKIRYNEPTPIVDYARNRKT